MKIIPVFLPYAGCKTRCIYCNQYIATGEKRILLPVEVKEKLHGIVKEIKEDFLIGFYGGSFLNLPDPLINIYLKALPKSNKFKGVRISSTFDSFNEEKIISIKKVIPHVEMEFGLESLSLKVQQIANRVVVKKKEILNKIELCQKHNIPFYIHIMLGLPGEKIEDYFNTCKFVAKIQPAGVRIHPTIIIRNTILEFMYKKGLYKPLSLDEAAYYIAKSLKYFIKNSIPITRLGLFPDVSLQKEQNIIGGPFHPAFGSIVWSYYYRFKLEKKMENGKHYIIHTPEKLYSYIVGFKRCNKKYFEKKGIHFIIKIGKRLMVKKGGKNGN